MYREYKKALELTTKRKKSGESHRRPIKVKTISRQFQNLVEAIYGNKFLTSRLSYASVTSWILKRTYWTAVYLFGFYFTLQSVIEIIAKYDRNPSYFQIENKQFVYLEPIKLPNFTVCLPKSYMGLNDEALTTDESMYMQRIATFFGENTKDGVFNVSIEEIWPDEIYHLAWKYLEMIYEGEWLIESRQNPFSNWENQKNATWLAALKAFNAKVSKLNVTIDQGKNIFMGKLIYFRKWYQEECRLDYRIILAMYYNSYYPSYYTTESPLVLVS